MTIFLFEAGTALLLAAAPAPGTQIAVAPSEAKLEDCTSLARQGPITEYECVGRNISRKEKRLEEAFGQAHAYIIDHENKRGMQDVRRSPIYLEWSQSAWKEFAQQNCAVIAGLTGGSNAWVSRYETDCYSAALDERIKFLEDIANGKVGAD